MIKVNLQIKEMVPNLEIKMEKKEVRYEEDSML